MMVIYDVDEDNALIRPEEGVPHLDTHYLSDKEGISYFQSGPSSAVHNPYPCFGAPGVVWPRGFPLDKVHEKTSSVCGVGESVGLQDIGVVQGLANHDADVDAIYRLTSPQGGLPLNFPAQAPSIPTTTQLRAIPASAFTPYNAQASLHFPVAFWGLLLPVTVHGRVSDIWRSYFTQTLLQAAGAVAVFAPAWVEHVGNPHNYLADFQAELPLYERSGALVDFLLRYRHDIDNKHASADSFGLLPAHMDHLVVTMYEYGIVDAKDVALTQAWLQDLRDAGYNFEKDDEHHDMVPESAQTVQLVDEVSSTLQVSSSGSESPHVLVVIAVLSARPERREAIRKTWLAWADGRVELRFFTETPSDDDRDAETVAALREEAAAYGDLVLMDIDTGMNFAVKMLWAMRWMSHRFTFDFFLRLDDDYFLCLPRILDELQATSAVAQQPLKIYAGQLRCNGAGSTRIDEAYLLLSAEIFDRVVSAHDLMCGGHAGTTAGWWFTPGNQLNPTGDVEWVNDYRLDATGEIFEQRNPDFTNACAKHTGVHRTFPDNMINLWEMARNFSWPERTRTAMGFLPFEYVQQGDCKSIHAGMGHAAVNKDNWQPCDTFKGDTKMHCGAAGC